ncbi:SinI family autotransporter-associated protein [Yersinia intermedia]|uniref:SinI family autotransporter-associated protein n=1 Tax=Yersinia intermedia TaxID=631 RepID=UPI0022FE5DB2|nr:SinI family autotransporter-associated protein [Yersinia intermedia]MDA5494125.1 SinI family autotransporter-associated protein [Yersinia intermedia]
MKATKTFTLKKMALALAIAGFAMTSAYAIMTPGTGTIQGVAPILKSDVGGTAHSVTLAAVQAVTGKLSTGDTITLSYVYTDDDGDGDASNSHVTWSYYKGTAWTDISSVNTPAATVGGTGTSVMVMPSTAVGATKIRVVIQEYSASGDPMPGQTITIGDISETSPENPNPTDPGPVIPGTDVVPAIYLASDTGFTTNLIGSATKLDVGATYVFKLWSDVAKTVDLTPDVNYNWRLVGASADTVPVPAPANGFVTSVSDANFTVPVNTAPNGTPLTGAASGAQGYNLAVDYVNQP